MHLGTLPSKTFREAVISLKRGTVQRSLEAAGIETRPMFVPIHTLPPYRGNHERRDTSLPVTDRLGHDRRYAIDSSKAHRELQWKPRHQHEEGIRETIDWYVANRAWWQALRQG